MATIDIDRDNVPLKAYLRADPYSQHFKFADNSAELVSPQMFWGTESEKGLYLDFSSKLHSSMHISEGLTLHGNGRMIYGSECIDWIQNNMIHLDHSKLFVIQGYAGCGKTTFIQHIIHNNSQTEYSYINIGKNWSYLSERHMFFTELLNEFIRLLDEISILPKRIRTSIWRDFVDLASNPNVRNFDLEIPNAIQKLKDIKKRSTYKSFVGNVREHLSDTYGDKYNKIFKGKKATSLWHNIGQSQTILALLILLTCAKYSHSFPKEDQKKTFCFAIDNSDVITDPVIPAENTILFWAIIDRYEQFRSNLSSSRYLPAFKILFTIRKVLYSHIISFLPDLEMAVNLNNSYVRSCDISNLYPSLPVMEHRIEYWKTHIDDADTIHKFDQLRDLISVHRRVDFNEEGEDEEPQRTIDLDTFFNHNYRAFANVLSKFLEDKRYVNILIPNFSDEIHLENWQKVAAIIFSLSWLYRKENVWNAMGFGCKDFDASDYPTTISRLLLNYLFMARCGHELRKYTNSRSDLPAESDVSLQKIIEVFNRVKFFTIISNSYPGQIEKQYDLSTTSDTTQLLLNRLASMCARNPTSIHGYATGYDSDDDEHWRRPLYFVDGIQLDHTAASYQDLKEYFLKSVSSKKANQIRFAITDEGLVLIRDIVATFEFYSGRYCESLIKPLYQAASTAELDILVGAVYSEIEKCCERNLLFGKEYMQKYKLLDKDSYLQRQFHPRTHPRFSKSKGSKKLMQQSFRPQLHIVRVIYNHIAYLNEVKRFIAERRSAGDPMCKRLTEWIGDYLKLYKNYFYSFLDNSICLADNRVYTVLQKQYNAQLEQYENKGFPKNISISMPKIKSDKPRQSD